MMRGSRVLPVDSTGVLVSVGRGRLASCVPEPEKAQLQAEYSRGRLSAVAAVVVGGLLLAACASTGREAPNIPPPSDASRTSVKAETVSNSAIVALVNDQPITRYDVDQRSRLMRIGGVKSGRSAATEELIDEKLQVIEGLRRGVRVPDAQVEAAYGGIARQLKMSTSQLGQALRSEGINPKSLKERLRAQITWRSLVEARVQMEAQISTADVTAQLLARGPTESITLTEYMLQQIVFVVPSGSGSGVFTQRRREANSFRQRYRGCDSALAQAQELKGVVVKDIGRRGSDQLSGQRGEEIKKLTAGQISQPIQIDQGIELIGVCSRRDVKSTAAARAEIQDKFALEQAQGLGEGYLKELREAAIIEYR